MTVEPMGIFTIVILTIVVVGVVIQLRNERKLEMAKQGGWSRQQKRAAKMNLNGKNQKPTEYVRTMAAKLPPVKDEKGRNVSHYHGMMQAYYKAGTKGIGKYWNWAIGEAYNQKHGK